MNTPRIFTTRLGTWMKKLNKLHISHVGSCQEQVDAKARVNSV